MSEPIKTRRCYKCKEIKPLTEFHNSKNSTLGKEYKCKICTIVYQQSQRKTKEHKKWRIKYQSSDKFKQYQQTYKKTKKYREVAALYRKSNSGKLAQQIGHKKYCLLHPERIKARNAVAMAITRGDLPKAKTKKCFYCNKQAQYWHHHLGYSEEHRMDVVPTCKLCDNKSHKLISRIV